MVHGTEHVAKHDLSSLRILGSVGEPINPEAWRWYHTHVGGGKLPIVDTWWQTVRAWARAAGATRSHACQPVCLRHLLRDH